MNINVPIPQSKLAWKHAFLLLLVMGTLVAMLYVEPIPQDPAYHHFVDARAYLGIKNCLNVLSNLPFLIVGAVGLLHLVKHSQNDLRMPWAVFFFGVSMVAFGSAYYHWKPDNASLVWDRLPMTVGFMGLFVGVLAEYINKLLGKVLLVPAIVVGVWSVFYWQTTGDLRFYAWVQFMPLLVVAFVLIAYKSPFTYPSRLGIALALYMLAKGTEVYDVLIFQATGNVVSGHTLKHLIAALACYSIFLMLRKQKI